MSRNVIMVRGREVYLTAKELDTLIQIEQFMLKNQVPPTIRDLCGLCGVSSTSTMHARIQKMADVGVVRKFDDTSRGIPSVRLEYVPVGG